MRARPDAIVLAGGLGTRLGARSDDLPKVLLPVAGRPFLTWVLDELAMAGLSRVVLAVGHLHQAVIDCIGDVHGPLTIAYSVEDQPLGTGGAVVRALGHTTSDHVLVVNGDTYAGVDVDGMLENHHREDAELTLGIRWQADVGRYGAVDISDGRVVGFAEKTHAGPGGGVNGGVCLVDRLAGRAHQQRAVLVRARGDQRLVDHRAASGFELSGPWIDIGVPEDLARAAEVLVDEQRVAPS